MPLAALVRSRLGRMPALFLLASAVFPGFEILLGYLGGTPVAGWVHPAAWAGSLATFGLLVRALNLHGFFHRADAWPEPGASGRIADGLGGVLLEGLIIVDGQGRIVAANPAAERILGYGAEALRGRDIHSPEWRAIREDGRPQNGDQHPVRLVSQSGQPVEGAVMAWFSATQGRHVWTRVSAIPDPRGEPAGPRRIYLFLADITPQRTAEDALRSSEDRYRELMDYMPAAVSLKDLDGRYLFVNRSFEALAGKARDEILGRKVGDVFPPDHAGGAAAGEKLALSQGEGVQYEEILPSEDGFRLFLSEAFPLRDEHGRIHSLGSISTDITARKRAEFALSTEALRRRVLLDHSRDGIVVIDASWHVIEANPSFAALIGWRIDEVVGQPLSKIDDRWSEQRLIREFGENPADGGLLETIQKRRDGSECDLEIAWAKASWMESDFLLWIVRDVSERKRAETELRRSRAELARAQGLARLGNYAVDFETGVFSWSEDLKAMLGCCGREPSYALWLSLVHPDDRDRVMAEKLRASTMRDAFDAEYRIVRPDGAMRWHHDRASLDFSDTGVPLRGFGTVQDVTDRKLAEAENARLQQQLQQAQKMEAIGQLTGGFAHDFNNILASILGYTSLALERYVPDKTGKLADYLREVKAAGERARDLIAKMLLFSRSRPVESAEPLAAQDSLRETVRMLEAAIPSTIELVTHIDASTPPFLMDAVELQQIVTNLVLNARDAVGGQGRIELELGTTDIRDLCCSGCMERLGGPYVRLAVIDTGSGLAPGLIARIFDPFFTTKPHGKGTGMGLAVVHGIVHRHHGHILVESELGQGTAFSLLFPACGRDAAPVPPVAEINVPPILKGSGRIVIVDDEPALVRMQAEMLAALGYQTTSFTDSRDALAHIRAAPEQLDALITDQTMPGLTGAELARAVSELRPDLPILLCSGFSEQVDALSALNDGRISRFFSKPVSFQQLAGALAELLPVCAADS